MRGHPGWTGHVNTSYDALPDYERSNDQHAQPSANTPALYDGKEQVNKDYLYWKLVHIGRILLEGVAVVREGGGDKRGTQNIYI